MNRKRRERLLLFCRQIDDRAALCRDLTGLLRHVLNGRGDLFDRRSLLVVRCRDLLDSVSCLINCACDLLKRCEGVFDLLGCLIDKLVRLPSIIGHQYMLGASSQSER